MSEEFIGIDPSTWVDPKITFPGIIEVSQYRDASDEYMEKYWQTRRVATPPLNSDGSTVKVKQWLLRVKRLDAKLLLPDGSEDKAMARFWGLDLQKWNDEQKALVGLSSRNKKELEILNSFKQVFGTLEPPESLEGKIGMFDFWESKAGQGGFAMKNVIHAVAVLPPNYTYEGEVRVFKVRAQEGEGSGSGTAAEAPAAAASVSEDQSYEELAKALEGKDASAEFGTYIADLPDTIRNLPHILIEMTQGSALDTLKGKGLVTVNGDGVIKLA